MPRAGGRTEGSEAQPHWGEHRNPAVRTAATQERCLTKPKCGAVGLRACGCQSPLAAEAALRHSDARPGGAALRMAPGSSAGSCLMRWVWTPFMGRCLEPVAGRRDPKCSPTGASIEMPDSAPSPDMDPCHFGTIWQAADSSPPSARQEYSERGNTCQDRKIGVSHAFSRPA
ncbi:hypothetical protein DXK93_18425 [Achromobacter sp. K91]|nr:hypothetical protein DXK93_18425 [Achromobacter sp. K91]